MTPTQAHHIDEMEREKHERPTMKFHERLLELAGKATPGPLSLASQDRMILGKCFTGEWKSICDKVRGGTPTESDATAELFVLVFNHATAIAALIEKGEKLKTHLEQGWDESDDPKDIAAADTACDEFIAALSALNKGP